MDNPNITIEEYIRLHEEKALSRVIVLDDTSREALSWEPTVSHLNDNEIDFRISFDESDDEDYMVIYDENSFSYKIIYVNDLKMDSENDNDKVNMPLFSTPELEVSYSNDLDFFKDFENEFPAIVYNDALTSKSDFLTEPTESPQHIDEFNLKNETSLSECDEKEQNILYFNDLFPFNVIYPDDLKSDTDNDNDIIDIERSSRDINTNYVKESELASLFGKLKYEENRIDRIYESEKKKYLITATPLPTTFFSTFIVQDFQDSPDDEEDTRSSQEYLNDEEDTRSSQVLKILQKRVLKKPQTTIFSPSQQKPELRLNKDFEEKYNKFKAKLAILSSDVSSDDNDMTEVKVLMRLLVDDDNVVLLAKEVSKMIPQSGQTDLVFVKSSSEDKKVSILGVERPWLSKAEGFTLLNHDTGRILPAES
ncbi:hypothetical protein Tco_1167042 [Tanacetum coccineum]